MAPPRKAERMKLASKGEAQAKSAPGAPRGAYPTDTPGRAVAAKAYSTKAVEAGRMSEGTKAGIDRRANKELGVKATAKKISDRIDARRGS